MNDFAILLRIKRLCRSGASIGSAYLMVADETGQPHARVVDVYLRALFRRIDAGFCTVNGVKKTLRREASRHG